MNVARAVKLADGSHDLLARELQLYLDPKTNEVLHTWHNPYSEKNVTGSFPLQSLHRTSFMSWTVVHVANNPVYQNFPAGRTCQARLLPGNRYTFQISIPLAYPNPLNPTADPNSPLFPYSGPDQALYTAIESFTYTFSASELESQPESIDTMQLHWTRTSPLPPFMATPSTNTSLLFVATGSKVKEGWKGLSPIVRDVIEQKVPVYKDAPTERTAKGGGVTSWSYFAKPEVLQAYLDGAVFPLPDPPQ